MAHSSSKMARVRPARSPRAGTRSSPPSRTVSQTRARASASLERRGDWSTGVASATSRGFVAWATGDGSWTTGRSFRFGWRHHDGRLELKRQSPPPRAPREQEIRGDQGRKDHHDLKYHKWIFGDVN